MTFETNSLERNMGYLKVKFDRILTREIPLANMLKGLSYDPDGV